MERGGDSTTSPVHSTIAEQIGRLHNPIMQGE
jgi:hypothetical protein